MSTEPQAPAHIAELAVHLTRLSRRLDQLANDHNDIAELAYRLAADTADIRRVLTEHNKPPPTTPPAPCWPTMTTDQAAAHWEALADWLAGTFVPWYQITRDQLPDCWALHRPAVIELSWLHHTHRAAHQPDAHPHLIAQWHTDWKPAALRTIADTIPQTGARTCSPGYHLATDTERTPPPRPPIPTPGSAGVHIIRTPPSEQLAQPQHWQTYYHQARAQDLASRDSEQRPLRR